MHFGAGMCLERGLIGAARWPGKFKSGRA
jgi:hypothetical protein